MEGKGTSRRLTDGPFLCLALWPDDDVLRPSSLGTKGTPTWPQESRGALDSLSRHVGKVHVLLFLFSSSREDLLNISQKEMSNYS